MYMAEWKKQRVERRQLSSIKDLVVPSSCEGWPFPGYDCRATIWCLI